MLLRTLAATALLFCLAATAQAGAVYGDTASATFSSPIVQNAGAISDMNSAPDGSAARFRNNQIGSGAQTFTVNWDVDGAEGNIDWRLFVLGRTDSATSVSGITLTDSGGNDATSTNSMVINTGPTSSTTITMFDLTEFQDQSDYGSVDTGFIWTQITGLTIQFTLNNPVATTTRTTINIDAVANPEPTTLALFGLGLLGLGAAVRRRRRALARA